MRHSPRVRETVRHGSVSSPHSPVGSRASPEDDALGWFVALQRAQREHDFELGARAERALERLGYVVRVVRPIPSPEGPVPASERHR